MFVCILGGCMEGYLHIPLKEWTGVSWIHYNALGKALATLLKYLTQIQTNFRNKSVKGVSPLMFAIDFIGGVISIS